MALLYVEISAFFFIVRLTFNSSQIYFEEYSVVGREAIVSANRKGKHVLGFLLLAPQHSRHRQCSVWLFGFPPVHHRCSMNCEWRTLLFGVGKLIATLVLVANAFPFLLDSIPSQQ